MLGASVSSKIWATTGLRRLVQLNQVAAGVREHGERHRSGLCRLPCERDALRGQSGELARDVGHLEGGEWNALRKHRFLKRLAGRIGIRFQGEFQVVGPFRRGDRDPSVLADRNVVLLLEAQDLRVEPQALSWSSTMMLVSLMRIETSVTEHGSVPKLRGSGFSKTATRIRKCRR